MAVVITNTFAASWSTGVNITVPSVTLNASDVADVFVAWRQVDGATSTLLFDGTTVGVTQNAESAPPSGRVGVASYRIVGRTGTAPVQSSMTAAINGGLVMVTIMSGVDNTTPIGTVSTVTDEGGELGALSTSVTLGSGDLALGCISTVTNTTTSMSMNSGQTSVHAVTQNNGEVTAMVSSKTGIGSVNLGYTWNGVLGWFARLIVVPYLAASVTPPSLVFQRTSLGSLANLRR